MLREYKFRAEPIHGEGFVYGYFKKNRYGDCYIEYDCRSTVVKPDSVVPLVGHDRDGKEVYEGDWVWRETKDWDEHKEEYIHDKLYYQVEWDEEYLRFYLQGYKHGGPDDSGCFLSDCQLLSEPVFDKEEN